MDSGAIAVGLVEVDAALLQDHFNLAGCPGGHPLAIARQNHPATLNLRGLDQLALLINQRHHGNHAILGQLLPLLEDVIINHAHPRGIHQGNSGVNPIGLANTVRA